MQSTIETKATCPTRPEIDAELIQHLRETVGIIHRNEYCAMTGRTIRAVKRDWTLRRGPKPIQIGMEIFYKLADVKAYIEELARRAA
jgi:hypothetical protein